MLLSNNNVRNVIDLLDQGPLTAEFPLIDILSAILTHGRDMVGPDESFTPFYAALGKVGDRTKGLDYGKDGSLTIHMNNTSPGKDKESNWLPAPGGRTAMMFRILIALALVAPTVTAQQPETNQANDANNPLTPKITVNFHNQWAPELYDSDEDTNAFLLRGVIPHRLGGQGQLFRYTLPVVTAPTQTGDTTGLGDLNLIDLFPFKAGKVEVAIGPQLTLPTASEDETGTGKWQAGVATIIMAPQHWGLFGSLITWQTSFAGDDDRSDQNSMSFQPLFIYNFPKGWYARSTATMTWDFERNTHVIPIGAGIGKVLLRPSGTSINIFAEPQWTIDHEGVGQPKFQVFAGVNLQFPMGKR